MHGISFMHINLTDIITLPDEPCRIGNYDEASIRYRGKYIPSPSFRLLQTIAKDDLEQNQKYEPCKLTVNRYSLSTALNSYHWSGSAEF